MLEEFNMSNAVEVLDKYVKGNEGDTIRYDEEYVGTKEYPMWKVAVRVKSVGVVFDGVDIDKDKAKQQAAFGILNYIKCNM